VIGGVNFRLLNPQPPVQQIFELTRMHHLFEIVQRSGLSLDDSLTPNQSPGTVATP
jgi:anti-anti-sigma regulatory factor